MIEVYELYKWYIYLIDSFSEKACCTYLLIFLYWCTHAWIFECSSLSVLLSVRPLHKQACTQSLVSIRSHSVTTVLIHEPDEETDKIRQSFLQYHNLTCKVHIFWEGRKILRNLHRRFDWHYIVLWSSQNIWTLTSCCKIEKQLLGSHRTSSSRNTALWNNSI